MPVEVDMQLSNARELNRARQEGGKEHLGKGANPRFVVTSLPAERFSAQTVCVEIIHSEEEGGGSLHATSKQRSGSIFESWGAEVGQNLSVDNTWLESHSSFAAQVARFCSIIYSFTFEVALEARISR